MPDWSSVPGTTPVLVGVGLVSQRNEDPGSAEEPLALMVRAARAAGVESGAPNLLRDVERIYVPKGRWRYRDPGRAIGKSIGAAAPVSVLARVGVLQERLIGDACERIRDGEAQAALVVGGDAGFRLLRARIEGRELLDSEQDSEPDEVWRASEPIMTRVEIEGGLGETAPPYYAVIDSAMRAKRGVSVDQHRSDVANLYSGFSRIAADNPHAWRQASVAVDTIRDPSDRNPMIAFPYTKLHTSDWSVDQASALLLCSAEHARSVGVPFDRWVFPVVSAVSDHMVSLSERTSLDRCPGADIAARAALARAELSAGDIDTLDIYSCFPAAVLTHAEALGVGPERPLTVTGGMRFGGGPFNNYVLHATAQVANQLRESSSSVGLVTSVSGVLTKHAFSVWSARPTAEYEFVDVTSQVDEATERKPVVSGYAGAGTVAGYTVRYDTPGAPMGVAVIDTEQGARTVAWSDQESVVHDMLSEDFCGRRVEVEDGHFTPDVGGATR